MPGPVAPTQIYTHSCKPTCRSQHCNR